MQSQFGRVCRLAGALETNQHQDLRWPVGDVQRLAVSAEDFDELLVDDANSGLRWGERFEDILTNSSFADGGDEVFDDFEVDVRFQQGATNFAHGVVDVLLSQS